MFCCHALLHDVFASNSTTAAMHACPSMLSAVHVHTGVLLHNALVAASPSLVAGGSGALTDTNTAYSANGARVNDGGQLVHHVRTQAAQLNAHCSSVDGSIRMHAL
jgi:hypothetical protein